MSTAMAMAADAPMTFAPLAPVPSQPQQPAASFQVVRNKPLPRQYMYSGDLVRGTAQADAAFQAQVGRPDGLAADIDHIGKITPH
jgi:hypothetical protein